ncbi:MAG: addiction module protein [Nitrospira sp.]|nr:addiction module protein [Nitrospira sp.]
MAPSTQQLLKDALQLTDEQRAALVVELLDSLPPVEPGRARSDAEWLVEIERRAWAAQAGVPGVAWEEARKQVVDRLPKQEAPQSLTRSCGPCQTASRLLAQPSANHLKSL